MGEEWGRVLNVLFIRGGERDKPFLGKIGRIKIEDVIIYSFEGMRKPYKSDLIAQVFQKEDLINVRTTGDDYQFKVI